VNHRAKWFGLILLLTPAAPLWVANAPTVEAQGKQESIEARLFSKAEDLFRLGKLDEAMEDLSRVRKLNPAHLGVVYYTGEFWFRKGDHKKAADCFKQLETHPEYGAKARQRLSEMALLTRQASNNRDIKAYLDGGAFPQAMEACKEALALDDENPDLLLTSAYTAAMLMNQPFAEKMYKAFAAAQPDPAKQADLRNFLDGWFSHDYAPLPALQRLLAVTDPRLRTTRVIAAMKEIMLSNKMNDAFEQIILDEAKRPGADRTSLDRDLVKFYIETGQFEKGLRFISNRPVDSMEDNLNYIELLTLSAQEEKAMLTARSLTGMKGEDIRLHLAWIRAFQHLVGRTGLIPSGSTRPEESLQLVAISELNQIMNDPAESTNPSSLMVVLRTSIVINDRRIIGLAMEKLSKIPLEDRLLEEMIEAASDMTVRDYRSEAISFLEVLLSQRPDNPHLQRSLAENYFLENRNQEALSLLQSAYTAEPQSIRTFMLLVDSMAAEGQIEKALDMVIERQKDTSLNDAVLRQLKAKANVLGGSYNPESDQNQTNGSIASPPGSDPKQSNNASTPATPAIASGT